ncbi:MAG: hypothetical protein QNK04_06600 [Myxococcota bacterium]|nr:hypothetical protein [Myxococcota bacterium]
MRVFGILWLALPSLVVMAGLAILAFTRGCQPEELASPGAPLELRVEERLASPEAEHVRPSV